MRRIGSPLSLGQDRSCGRDTIGAHDINSYLIELLGRASHLASMRRVPDPAVDETEQEKLSTFDAKQLDEVPDKKSNIAAADFSEASCASQGLSNAR
jgi:hypothetical protein